MKLTGLGWVAYILVLIGGLNWGLIGAFEYNLISSILGTGILTQIVYILAGVGAIYLFFIHVVRR